MAVRITASFGQHRLKIYHGCPITHLFRTAPTQNRQWPVRLTTSFGQHRLKIYIGCPITRLFRTTPTQNIPWPVRITTPFGQHRLKIDIGCPNNHLFQTTPTQNIHWLSEYPPLSDSTDSKYTTAVRITTSFGQHRLKIYHGLSE
jgi:hypothetical protein